MFHVNLSSFQSYLRDIHLSLTASVSRQIHHVRPRRVYYKLAHIKNPDAKINTTAFVGNRWFYLDINNIVSDESSIGESVSAFCASSLKDFSAVSCLHSFSEAVLLLSLALFRLVGSEHLDAPPLVWYRKRKIG